VAEGRARGWIRILAAWLAAAAVGAATAGAGDPAARGGGLPEPLLPEEATATYEHPAWSPDGRELALAEWWVDYHPAGRSRSRARLLVLAAAGRRSRVVWESGRGAEYRRIERIQWGRDGRRLMFSEACGPFASDDRRYLTRLVTPGGGAAPVLGEVNLPAWDWSWDGRWVIFKALQGAVRDGSAGPGLWMAGMDGEGRRRILPTREDSSWADFPAWSPDGMQIAYFFGKQGPPSFVSLGVADRRGQAVTLWRQRDTGFTQFVAPAWSPGGERVYAAVDETLVEAQPAAPAATTTRSAGGTIAAVAPEAGVLAVFGGGDLRLAALNGGAETALTRGGAFAGLLREAKLGAWDGEREFAAEVAITKERRVAVTVGRGLYRFAAPRADN
jgi:hypothetical protein